MSTRNRIIALTLAIAGVVGFSGCGSGDDSTAAASETAVAVDDASDRDEEEHEEEGHDDEEGHDEDHDEEEDHDEDHDEAETGLGAHEHGAAELAIAWSEGDMVIDLISPTYNIFGFEYEPTTDEDLAIVADRTEALSDPGVVAVNSEAGCNLAGDVATDLEFEGSHAELTASWLLVCDNPDEIRSLDTTALFAEFPNLEDIDVQWASASGQSAAELSPSATVVDLE